MSAIGFLHRVDGERADRVYTELIERRGLSRFKLLHIRCHVV